MIPTYSLFFRRAASWEELRTAWTEVILRLRGAAGPWELLERVEIQDKNAPQATFRATWSSEGAALTEEVVNGSGNPRDGYGYDVTATLEVEAEGEPVLVRLKSAGYNPELTRLQLSVQASAERVELVRAGLRAVLGAEADRTSEPQVAVGNVALARLHDPEAAVRWLREALDAGRPEGAAWGWKELLQAAEELEAPDPQRLGRRLTEAPHDVDAWEQAALAPPPGWAAERVARVLERLRPYDPGATTPPFGDEQAREAPWRRLENGLGPTGSSDPLMWNLARNLYPGLPDGERSLVDVGKAGRHAMSSTLHVEWAEPGDDLPVALVQRRAVEPGREVVRGWLLGRAIGDVVRFGMESIRRKQRTLHLGVALASSGSPAFVARVEEIVERLTPYRLEPAEEADLFPERTPRRFVGLSGVGSIFEQVVGLLEATGSATPDLLHALEVCACEQPRIGYCSHATAFLEASRAYERVARTSKDPSESTTAYARKSALSAGMALLAPSPHSGVERNAKIAAEYLSIVRAIR